jgi:enamine deaminase RidA (YjgF/YER057c/UK114 family)
MTVTRHHIGKRMSQIVVHNDTVYLAGQVGDAGVSVTDQTKGILTKIDSLLAEVGSDKTKILQAVIWLDDMKHFGEMNAVWDAWVADGAAPARACGEARLASPDLQVEIIIIAAL